jgi:xylose isomerase
MPYQPVPADKFTFGLWTVGNRGRDPFGDFVRPPLDPVDAVGRLGQLGAWGVNFHDNDLVPIAATAAERDRIISRFRQALDAAGMCVPMATTNLFTEPVFKDGAFTSHDPRVRAFALQKTMRAMDLGVELGAKTYVFWGGREGAEVDAAKDAVEAIKRFREAIDFLCEYARDQKFDLRFALEAKPNEPRGDIYFPTTASYLAFIGTLAHPEMVGVNPEVAHKHTFRSPDGSIRICGSDRSRSRRCSSS